MCYILPDEVKFLKIPEIFYSEATNQQFIFCMDCEKYLLDQDTLYVIEKGIKKYKEFNTSDTIFEYALCFECLEKLWNSYSEESTKKIDEYFHKHIAYKARISEFKDVKNEDLLTMISKCIIKDKSINEVNEYQLIAICVGEELFVYYTPYMICGEAIGEIVQLLSNKTIDVIGGFIDEFLGVPPEFLDKEKPKLLII